MSVKVVMGIITKEPLLIHGIMIECQTSASDQVIVILTPFSDRNHTKNMN